MGWAGKVSSRQPMSRPYAAQATTTHTKTGPNSTPIIATPIRFTLNFSRSPTQFYLVQIRYSLAYKR